MFSRNKKQHRPPYIEGTQGRYVKRASPPPVPSLTSHTHTLAKKVDIFSNNNAAQTSKTFTSPDSHFSLADNSGRLHSSSVLSSSSNYSLPSTHLMVNREFEENRKSPVANLSSQSFSDPCKREHRKPLTASHSIGNVESFVDNLETSSPSSALQQQRFVSLQSLPSRNLGSSIIGDDCLVSGTPQQDELPLPPNWAVEVTLEGFRYYVDHTTRRTHWIHPLARENLPPGWSKIFQPSTGVIYYNEVEGRSQIEHPGLAPPINRTESMVVASRRTESAVENLNIIHQKEVPDWLMMYSQADTSLDHLLEWELFSTVQLEQYEDMMLKLYKQEVIDTVRRYERLRTVLNREIVRRTQPHPKVE